MDAYDSYAACGRITEFVDALSNWYVRRSRNRFWSGEQNADKLDAYWTLYECLLTTARLIAPFTPFVAEALWQNLARAESGERAAESVHLTDFPTGDPKAVDEALSARMSLAREIVSLGRAARMSAKLKVRQPLAKVEVVLADATHRAWLEEHAALVAEELNVKQVEFPPTADQYITYTVLPDLKRLGPRLGRQLPALKQALAEADPAELLDELRRSQRATITLPEGAVELDSDDLQVRLAAKEGWTAAQGRGCVVVLSTGITPELAAEGLARELVHAVQSARKDTACDYTDRIEIGLVTASAELRAAAEKFADYIRGETLARRLAFEPLPGVSPIEIDLGGHKATLYVKNLRA
jgi:isoleucyl-tRNA synthetase